jgi:Ulp1 family protease
MVEPHGVESAQVLGLKAIVIPIFMDAHWLLAIINVECRQFEVYDSLLDAGRAMKVCEVIVASRRRVRSTRLT